MWSVGGVYKGLRVDSIRTCREYGTYDVQRIFHFVEKNNVDEKT